MQSEPATKLSTHNPDSETSRSAESLLLATVLLVLIGLIQLWIVTAGTFRGWPAYTFYYHQLADAFVHGQTSLRTLPSPELLAQPDPYDPRINPKLRLHDAVLFNGKYYLDWGPVPALIVAGGFAISHQEVPSFGDQYLVFPFLFGTVILATILIFHARARLFPRQPLWTAALPVISLGLGTPVLYTLARSAVYEASICAGQFFLMGGLLALWLGLCGPRIRPAFSLLAGISLALSVGSRVSLAIAVIAIAALALFRIWQLRGPGRQVLPAICGLMIPLLLGAFFLAWYNFARFGSITEFGLHYQLSFQYQHHPASPPISSFRYVPINLCRYLFTIPTFHKAFPFLSADSGQPRWASWFNPPSAFGFESVIGIAWGQPLLLMGVLAIIAPWWRKMTPPLPMADRAATIWLTLTLLAAAVLGFIPSLTIEGSTMRYLLDTVPALTVLAALGEWRALECLRKRLAIPFQALCILLLLAGSLMGILLGTSGYYQHFADFNPGLYKFMDSFFHL